MVPWLFGGLWSLGGPWFGGGFLVVSWWSLGAVLAASSWSSWCSATIWGSAPAQVPSCPRGSSHRNHVRDLGPLFLASSSAAQGLRLCGDEGSEAQAPPSLAAQSRAFPALEARSPVRLQLLQAFPSALLSALGQVLNISANAALGDVTAAMSLQVPNP